MLVILRYSRTAAAAMALGLACLVQGPVRADESPLAGIEGSGSGNVLPASLLASTFGGGAQAPAVPPAQPPAQPAQTPAPGEAKKDLPWGGYDRGWFLQSTDGKFRLTFNARIQARYTYFGKDSQGGDGNDTDESYFELERARIGLSGHFFDPSVRFKVEFDGETDAGDKGALTDAYVEYAPYYNSGEYISLGIGQFKPYFLRQEATSSSRQQRVERSLMTEFFNLDRNIGIWGQGYLDPKKMFFYNVALTNGIDTVNQASGGGGAQLLDQNPAYVGKLDFTILGDHKDSYSESDLKISKDPLLVVGGSAVHEQYDPGHVAAPTFVATEGKVTSFGLDALFKAGGASLSGEYCGRWYDQTGVEALYSHGWNFQAGYFIMPKEHVELTLRYSEIRGNEGPQSGHAYEIGPGINWFFSHSHNAKVQLDVAWVDVSDDLPSNTETLRLGPNAPFATNAAGFSEGEQGVLTRFQVQVSF